MKFYQIIGLATVFLFFIASVSASTESEILDLINGERSRLGRDSLAFNGDLDDAAKAHSEDMASRRYLSHTSYDGRTFVQRIKAEGYTNYYALGENIAYHSGMPNANKVYGMWRNSPGHYKNMISSSFNEIGIGVMYLNGYTYYTTDFGRRSNIQSPTNPTMPINPPVSPPINPPVNPPIQNLPVNTSNNSQFRLAVSSDLVRSSSYYDFYRLKGNTTERAKVQYTFLNKTRIICSNCNRFSVSFRVPRGSDLKVDFIATARAGNVVTYSI